MVPLCWIVFITIRQIPPLINDKTILQTEIANPNLNSNINQSHQIHPNQRPPKNYSISQSNPKINNLQQIMSNLVVSAQAFLQQIETWAIALARQTKKLKSFKPQVQNKFKLNSIDIVLTEIESLQIKYKKIKNKYKPLLNHHDRTDSILNHSNQNLYSEQLLTEYSQLSKSFMDVLEKVSLIQAQTNQPNFFVQKNQDQDNTNPRKKDKSFAHKKDREKTFLNETFAFKVSKQNKNCANIAKNKNKSIFEQRNSYKQKEQNKSVRDKAHSLIGQPAKIIHSFYNAKAKDNKQQFKTSSLANQEQDTSLWQVHHQLSKISQMMKEMKNEIKFHEHQQTNREINKIQNKNRKIASELKSVKEQNRVMMDKIDDLKRQLMDEKKMQVDLINKFEKKSHLANTLMYDSRATHGQNYKSLNQDMSHDGNKSPLTNRKGQPVENVSDWVRMRI